MWGFPSLTWSMGQDILLKEDQLIHVIEAAIASILLRRLVYIFVLYLILLGKYNLHLN